MNIKYFNMFCAGICFGAAVFSFLLGNIFPAIVCIFAMAMNFACVRWL